MRELIVIKKKDRVPKLTIRSVQQVKVIDCTDDIQPPPATRSK